MKNYTKYMIIFNSTTSIYSVKSHKGDMQATNLVERTQLHQYRQ